MFCGGEGLVWSNDQMFYNNRVLECKWKEVAGSWGKSKDAVSADITPSFSGNNNKQQFMSAHK